MRARGVNNFFYAQPVPYLYKALSESEKLLLLYGNKTKNKTIGSFLKNVDFEKINDLGLNIESLLKIFSKNSSNLYTDECCHLNKIGKNLLVKEIANRLGQTIKNQPRLCDYLGVEKYLLTLK